MIKISREERIELIFQYVLLLIFLALFALLLYPFLFVILFALAIVITTYPLYKKILKAVKKPIMSASLMLLLLTIIVVLPSYLILVKLFDDGVSFYNQSDSFLENSALHSCQNPICDRIQGNLEIIASTVSYRLANFSDSLSDNSLSIFASLSSLGIQIFILYVCLFYFYLDRDSFMRTIKNLLPLKTHYKEALIEKFRRVCSAVFLDSLLIAILQGTLVGIGFYIFGLPSALIWGIIASFLALLPLIGSGFIWVPGGLFLILTGDYISGIGLLLYGLLIVSMSDNLVRPLLLEKSIHVHPFLILMSIMGGIEIFGFTGIFYGPIIISLLVALVDMFEFEFK